MFKTYAKTIGIFMAFVAVFLIVSFFIRRQFQDQQGTMSLQENLQTAMVANKAQASRVKKGIYIIDRAGLESEVKKHLPQTKGAGLSNISNSDVKFAYLIDGDAKDLNARVTNSHGTHIISDLTDKDSKYIAVKGVRVLIDANHDGSFTGKQDVMATLAVDSKN